MHRYTEAEKEFLAEHVPGHSYRETMEAFTDKFDWEISQAQLRAYIKNNGLNTGRTGRFEKGSEPFNKGRKGFCAAGSEKGWFRKGHTPKNHKPVGSERTNRDGYVEIKTKEPDVWRLKHRVIWEQAHGNIPAGCVVILKDGNRENTCMENLMLVTKGVNAILNHTGMHALSGELKETAVKIAELKKVTADKKKQNRQKGSNA